MEPARDGRGAATVGPLNRTTLAWASPPGNGRSDGPNQVGQREVVGAGRLRSIVSGEGGGTASRRM